MALTTSARTPGAGEEVAVYEKSDILDDPRVQVVAFDLTPTDNATVTPLTGTAARGAQVDPRLLGWKASATPTLTATPYTSGDQVGGVVNFANVARANGGSGVITSAVLIDKAVQSAELELWLFAVTPPSPAGDNAAHSISDANLVTADPVGYLRFATYVASALNSISRPDTGDLPLAFTCDAADVDLYGLFVVRGTPTYAADSLVVALRGYSD